MPETTPLPLTKEDRMDAMTLIAMDVWSSEEDALAASYLEGYENLVAQLEAELAQVRAQQGAVRLDVSEIRQGEENDGPLMSTDLFVEGRGISLLCNVSAGESFTYYAKVDGQELGGGTVGTSSLSSEALATGTPPAPQTEGE